MSKKLLVINSSFLSLLFLIHCTPFQQRKDEYLKLTSSQHHFIHGVSTGDTVVWTSDMGYNDSAIVLPVQYQDYIVDYNKDGDVHLERAYYYYQFIGTKHSSYIPDGIGVEAIRNNSTGVANVWGTTGNIFTNEFTGSYLTHKIGIKTYDNVFFYPINSTDSIFINHYGYLGYKIAGENLYKTK